MAARFSEMGNSMISLTCSGLAQACRIFLNLAYQDGPEKVPVRPRAYWDLDESRPVEDYLPPSPQAEGVCEEIRGPKGVLLGYAFRLGSDHFRHLKLRVQRMETAPAPCWLFMVDTHDAFSRESHFPPADHPEAGAWRALQEANRLLKERIESALEEAGFTTPNSLLRNSLVR